MNEDGSQLIIEKLTIAAENINPARLAKIRTELNEISKTMLDKLSKYFHSDNKNENLKKAKANAGDIQSKLDDAFRGEGIKRYGLLMKELMLDEFTARTLYQSKINDVEHREIVDTDKYNTYRDNVPVIENDTDEAYFKRLCAFYEKTTKEDIQKFRDELRDKQIDLKDLIDSANRNSGSIKDNAQQLAEALLEYWLASIVQNDKHTTIRQILAPNGSLALQHMTDMFKKLFDPEKLDLAKQIAEKIRYYVNRDQPYYDIAADMSAELLNKCINTVGFDFFDESKIDNLRQTNEKYSLGLVLDQRANPTEKSVEELFTKIENWTDIINSKPEEKELLPNFRNFRLWYNRLKVGFVSVCDIPNYDVAANEKLGHIIKECETIKY